MSDIEKAATRIYEDVVQSDTKNLFDATVHMEDTLDRADEIMWLVRLHFEEKEAEVPDDVLEAVYEMVLEGLPAMED